MKKEISELNYTNFHEFLQGRTVLADFWAEWCQPCKIQQPMLEELAFEYDNLFALAKVNVDENKVIASKLGVRNIPTLILFRDGKELRRIIGLQSKEILIGQITNALSNLKTEHSYGESTT
ncbi:MAG: thioredoxin [Bacteroidales bacterium]